MPDIAGAYKRLITTAGTITATWGLGRVSPISPTMVTEATTGIITTTIRTVTSTATTDIIATTRVTAATTAIAQR
ncbi:MAG: hypothetical protein WA970_06455, partial [Gammaproteobacteria bacterium]